MLQFPPSNPKEPFSLLTGKGKKRKENIQSPKKRLRNTKIWMKYTYELYLGKMMSEIFFFFVEVLLSNVELSLASFFSEYFCS